MSAEILKNIYEKLHITDRLRAECKLAPMAEPPLSSLEVVDIDFEGKPFILEKTAARAWREMTSAARSEKIRIDPFSGFRSYVYQSQLIQRKLDKGRTLEVILTETAIPGYSEHHTGRAVDVCTDGIFDLTENFENTEAFRWLTSNSGRFGFRLSYPRHNDRGIIYEPWHWLYFRPPIG